MKAFYGFVLVGMVGGVFAVTGCSSPEDASLDVGEGNLVDIERPTTVDQQRAFCVDRVRENGALRDADLGVGVVRWKCGDVKGVSGEDLGQEYCEFHAVQEGTVVDAVAKSKVKAAKVECLFTGVYRDVKGAPGSSGTSVV